MKKSKATTDTWKTFIDLGNDRVNEAVERIKQKEKFGLFKEPPKNIKSIHCVEDLCRFIFARLDLDGSYQVEFDGDHIKTWVWNGKDFDSKTAMTVARIAMNLSDKDTLLELRLVATSVTGDSLKALRAAFPKTKMMVLTEAEDEANWRWSQAHYHGQTDDEWEDKARKQAQRRPL